MISLKKNPSFPQWIQVFAFGQFIEEVESKAKATRIATRLARKNGLTFINFFGKVEHIEQ